MASGKAANIAGIGTGIAATKVANKVAAGVWKTGSKGKEPPLDPTDPNPSVRETLVWAAVSGALVAVIRTLVARKLAKKERDANRVSQTLGR